MEMESSRRSSADRSRDTGLKKPRLSDEAERNRGGVLNANRDRTLPVARTCPPSDPRLRVSERERGERELSSGGGVKVPAYQPQPHQQELLVQYKTALAELTFNSKPIITNLTIIAGENLPSARAIASIVCTNILEVPSEQKLPSLYLLDSIVKNIGRDYIKYFAARLPDVFCKAYKQVDSSVHQSMKHLFGTWKLYFPASTLQMIEKELGFLSMPDSTSRVTVSKPESQTLRPAVIHVNPKYLEARQLNQQPIRDLSRGEISSGVLVDNSERPSRTTTFECARQWPGMPLRMINGQLPQAEAEPTEKQRYPEGKDDYSQKCELGVRRTDDRLKEEKKHEIPWYASDSTVSKKPEDHRNGFDISHRYGSYRESGSARDDRQLPSVGQKIANSSRQPTSNLWKSSEEEEFMWEDINSCPLDYVGTVSSLRSGRDFDYADKTSGVMQDKLSQLKRDRVDSNMSKLDAGAQSLNGSRVEDRIPLPRINEGSSLPQQHQQDFDTRVQIDSFSDPLSNQNSLFIQEHTSSSRSHIGQTSSGRNNLQLSGRWDPSTQQESLHKLSHGQIQQSHGTQNLQPAFSQSSQIQPNLSNSSASLAELRYNPLHQAHQQLNSRQSTSQLHKSPTPPVDELSETNQPSSSAVDLPGLSVSNNLLDTILKSKLFTSNSSSIFQKSSPQPPLPSGPPPIHSKKPSSPSLTTSSPLPVVPPPTRSVLLPLPPGPPRPSQPSTISKTPSAASSASNPLSNLLSSLVAKGLISSTTSDTPSTSYPNKSDQIPNEASSGNVRSAAAPLASTSLALEPRTLSPAVEQHSLLEPSLSTRVRLPHSCPDVKEHIGVLFKPEIIRESHSSVVDSLFEDFSHQCSSCGMRVKNHDELGDHFHQHVLKKLESGSSSSSSSSGRKCRGWFSQFSHTYKESSGSSDLLVSPSFLDDLVLTQDDHEPAVPADESQCICGLCGEPFDDFYSDELDLWMYKGAVYLNSSNTQSVRQNSNESTRQSPIVHSKCIERRGIS